MNKKTLCIFLAGLMMTPALSAESIITPGFQIDRGFSFYIPGNYCSDGTPKLVWENYENDDYSLVGVFDEDLNKVATINIPDVTGCEYYTLIRKRVLEYNPNGYKGEENIGDLMTLEELRERAGSEFFGHVTETTYNGRTVFYPTTGIDGDDVNRDVYFYYWELGTAYPQIAYAFQPSADNPGYGAGYRIYLNEGSYIITDRYGDPVREDEGSAIRAGYLEMDEMNYNNGHEGEIIVTQTLFNQDAEYEYLAPIYTTGLQYTEERSFYIREEYGPNLVGIALKTASGNELQRLTISGVDHISDIDLISIGSKTYLVLETVFEDGRYETFYLIDGNSALRQVGETVKIRVSPTVIGRGESVNVEVGKVKGTARVTVTDMNGRTVYSASVREAGVHQIPGSVMASGMNIVTVEGAGTGSRSTKVIVH